MVWVNEEYVLKCIVQVKYLLYVYIVYQLCEFIIITCILELFGIIWNFLFYFSEFQNVTVTTNAEIYTKYV